MITTYSYDTMNRPLTVNYNTTNAPGVATTDGFGYAYDNNNVSATRNKKVSAIRSKKARMRGLGSEASPARARRHPARSCT